MKKPSSLSESRSNEGVYSDKRVPFERSYSVAFSGQKFATRKLLEEAWLLLKLGRFKEAKDIVMPIYKKKSYDKDLVLLAGFIFIETRDFQEAKECIDKLKVLGEDPLTVKEMEARVFEAEGNFEKASFLLEELIKARPSNMNYKLDYAGILFSLRKWEKARGIYSELLKDDKIRSKIIWDYREILEEGGDFLSGARFLHGPAALREWFIEEEVNYFVSPELKIGAEWNEAIYHREPSGDTISAVKRTLDSHRISGEWFYKDWLGLYGAWETVYPGETDVHGFEIYAKIKKSIFNTSTGYTHNGFVTSPVESFQKNASLNRFWHKNDIKIFDRINIGNDFDMEWYKIDREGNNINGESYLGRRDRNDSYINFIMLKKPYITLNFHHLYAHWDQPFDRAEDVLDFIEDERVYYGGVYFEERFGDKAELNISASRTYDHKREFQSTLINGGLDFWIKDWVKLTFLYEYDIDIEGRLGSGDVQAATARIKFYF